MKSLAVFQGKEIRRTWHNDEWYFSVVDIIAVLTESLNSRRYWSDLKIKLRQEGVELYGFIVQLKLMSSDGKKYLTDCTNTQNGFRLIQSIPSKKAEPFKQWLAKVGYERTQEIENPELAQNRARKYYELKGYPKEWIEKRIRGIAIRQDLTNEWKQRGVEEGKELAILTDEISKATFGVSIKEHKGVKNIEARFKNQNLRDHMTDLELIFNMLGEASTTEIAKGKDVQGFEENKDAAIKGGTIAGDARSNLELESGKKVLSNKNYQDIRKRLK